LINRLAPKLNPHHSLKARIGLFIGGIALVLLIIASVIVGNLGQQIFYWFMILGGLFACIIKNLQTRNTELQTERNQLLETNLALEKEKEINKLKSQFISIASHEFRAPLTSILLSCHLLQNHNDTLSPESKQQHFNKIKSNVKHLNQILEDVLIIGKAEAGKLEFQPAPLDLTSFCIDLVKQIQISAGEHYHINFIEQRLYDSKTENLPLMDEKLLLHILTNLLTNAINYSPKGGEIRFELTYDQKSAIFRIQDKGIGIPEEDKANLFNSFFRCSNTSQISGTGLGLTIVKNAVELHRGQISVESELGVGTTFTVILPLMNSEFRIQNSELSIRN
jgi:signal transduction histidine kinase